MLLIFDINETLLDLSPLDDIFGNHRQWFDLLIRTATVRTAAASYVDFGHLGAICARQVLGIAEGADDPRLAKLTDTMRSLPPHPDTVQGLQLARHGGHRVVALANSPHATLDAQLDHAGLSTLFDATYSVEEVRALKPSPTAYRLVLEKEDVAASAAALIAAHDWDVAGASLAGLRTVLVGRGGIVALPGLPPTASAEDIPSAVRAAVSSATTTQH
jgi:2-haloacid dehalogenase